MPPEPALQPAPQQEYLDSRMSEINSALNELEKSSETDLVGLEEISDRYVLAYATNELHIALGERLETPEGEDLHIDTNGIEALQNRVDELERYLGIIADNMGHDEAEAYPEDLQYEIGDIPPLNLHDIEEDIADFNAVLEAARQHNAEFEDADHDHDHDAIDTEEAEEMAEQADEAGIDSDDVQALTRASGTAGATQAARRIVESGAEDADSEEERTNWVEKITDFFKEWFMSSGIGVFLSGLFGWNNVDEEDGEEDAEVPAAASEQISLNDLGEVVVEGPPSPTNFMNSPETNQLSDYEPASSNHPDRWYNTPRGLRWFDGEVLLGERHVKYLIRSGYRPNQGRSIEQFVRDELTTETRFFNGTFRANRELAWRLQNAERDLRAAGIVYNIDNSHTGAFSYRGIARQDYPYISNHAFGLAVDFNHDHNDWESGIIPDYEQQFGPRFEQIMAQNGLRIPRTWGRHEGHDHGDSRDIDADWMHFDIEINDNGTYMDTHSASLAYGN